MTRLALVIALMPLAACFQSHPSGQQELAGKDCYMCHKTDYATTMAPVHSDTPQVFSTECVNCHRTVDWKPALEGLHNEAFIMAEGPHAPIACLDCHDLDSGQPSMQGANTNCIQCHPDDAKQAESHDGVSSVANVPYKYQAAVPNFCLQCHPAGTADAHPDNLFPLTEDHAVACGKCHDRSAGSDLKGANVTCLNAGCHPLMKMDILGAHLNNVDHTHDMYVADEGDGTSRNFCVMCHSKK